MAIYVIKMSDNVSDKMSDKVNIVIATQKAQHAFACCAQVAYYAVINYTLKRNSTTSPSCIT